MVTVYGQCMIYIFTVFRKDDDNDDDDNDDCDHADVDNHDHDHDNGVKSTEIVRPTLYIVTITAYMNLHRRG